MAEIIALKDVKERKPKASAGEPVGVFQLLFFTGVRYERAKVVQSKPSPKRSPRLKLKKA